jgi:hypothetical protein
VDIILKHVKGCKHHDLYPGYKDFFRIGGIVAADVTEKNHL